MYQLIYMFGNMTVSVIKTAKSMCCLQKLKFFIKEVWNVALPVEDLFLLDV